MKKIIYSFLMLIVLYGLEGCKEEVIEINVLDSEIIFTHSEVLNGIAFSSSNNGVACGLNGSLLHTSNSGASWTDVISGDNDVDYYDIHFVNNMVGYVRALGGSVASSGILKTEDGGATWNSIFQPNGGDYLKQIQFVTPDVGYYIISPADDLYRTTNGGQNFSKISFSGFSFHPDQMAFHGDVGIVFDWVKNTYERTEDGGDSWIEPSNAYVNPGDVAFTENAQKLYVLDDNAFFHESSDYGNSWTRSGDALLEAYNEIYSPSIALPRSGMIVCSGFYATSVSFDSGISWKIYRNKNGTSISYNDLSFPTADIGYGISGLTINKIKFYE